MPKKRLVMLGLFAAALTLCACSIKPARDLQAHPGGVNNPELINCRQAIGGAYRRMVALKKNLANTVTYAQWSRANDLLASALSSMGFGEYKHCIKRASRLDYYLDQLVHGLPDNSPPPPL